MPERRILCVDDETNVLNALKRLLRNESYNLYTAASGVQGLSLLEKQPVEVIISWSLWRKS